MNLIDEEFQNEKETKSSSAPKIILAIIILLIIVIISLTVYLLYLENSTLKLTLDGSLNEDIKEMLVFEDDGTIYAPIKKIAQYFGYESYNGEYTDKSEEQSKCYVQSENEVANFELGENEIYKIDFTSGDNYEYITIENPVKSIDGVLYVSTEGLEKAFNISFNYDQEKNRITIYTLSYLYKYYSSKIEDYGYVEINEDFTNQKTILENMMVVLKDKEKEQYGVIGVDGTVILEPKYDDITYLPNTGDFLVETDNKVGIMSSNKETKVQIIYDSIETIPGDTGLYIAKKDNKYGVIDTEGNIKIYIEYDQIGLDISDFTQNNIKNQYIIADNLIPVKKDKYWALYNINGKQLTDFEYDGFGYITNNNDDKEAINLLVIPNYNVLVACKDDVYTLVNSSGKELFTAVADGIYMKISGGEKHYYIAVNDQEIDAEEWIETNVIKKGDS